MYMDKITFKNQITLDQNLLNSAGLSTSKQLNNCGGWGRWGGEEKFRTGFLVCS